jgi:hypothetical protein
MTLFKASPCNEYNWVSPTQKDALCFQIDPLPNLINANCVMVGSTKHKTSVSFAYAKKSPERQWQNRYGHSISYLRFDICRYPSVHVEQYWGQE